MWWLPASLSLFYVIVNRMSLRKADPLTVWISSLSVSIQQKLTCWLWEKPDSEVMTVWMKSYCYSLFPAAWTQRTLQLSWHLSLHLTDSDQCSLGEDTACLHHTYVIVTAHWAEALPSYLDLWPLMINSHHESNDAIKHQRNAFLWPSHSLFISLRHIWQAVVRTN